MKSSKPPLANLLRMLEEVLPLLQKYSDDTTTKEPVMVAVLMGRLRAIQGTDP